MQQWRHGRLGSDYHWRGCGRSDGRQPSGPAGAANAALGEEKTPRRQNPHVRRVALQSDPRPGRSRLRRGLWRPRAVSPFGLGRPGTRSTRRSDRSRGRCHQGRAGRKDLPRQRSGRRRSASLVGTAPPKWLHPGGRRARRDDHALLGRAEDCDCQADPEGGGRDSRDGRAIVSQQRLDGRWLPLGGRTWAHDRSTAACPGADYFACPVGRGAARHYAAGCLRAGDRPRRRHGAASLPGPAAQLVVVCPLRSDGAGSAGREPRGQRPRAAAASGAAMRSAARSQGRGIGGPDPGGMPRRWPPFGRGYHRPLRAAAPGGNGCCPGGHRSPSVAGPRSRATSGSGW